ncbi:hypothetical protein ACF0H5_001302 [Mactra antiquata]
MESQDLSWSNLITILTTTRWKSFNIEGVASMESSNNHNSSSKLNIRTILGNGMDCHLLGLREMAVELNMPTPDLFTDETYKKSNRFILSTSQVNTTMDTFMCYGPVVPNGYGVCYNPHPNKIIVCISAFKSDEETQSDYFAYTLEGSLLQMQELCRKTSEQNDGTEKLRNTATKNGPLISENNETSKKPLVRQKPSDTVLQENGHAEPPLK